MSRALTRFEADQTLRITRERHRAIKLLAIDRDASLIEIADEVVAAGVEALRERHRPEAEPSPAS